jgi:hypothetical protein
VNSVGVVLLSVILVPAWYLTEQWMEMQAHRVVDHMMWREPME